MNAALSLVLSLAVGTTVQFVPFQCIAIGLSKEVQEKRYPTAQTSLQVYAFRSAFKRYFACNSRTCAMTRSCREHIGHTTGFFGSAAACVS